MMLSLLNQPEAVIFTTREYARMAGLSLSAASRQLGRYARQQAIVHITKGVWANTGHPYFTPLACTPYLLGKEQGYVSFLTALHLHGMLSQIPARHHIATTGHTRRLTTPVGEFDFIRLKPELMREGVEWSETKLPYPMATPEKALIDTLYISTRKNRRFAALPELELDAGGFQARRFKALFDRLPLSSRIKNAMWDKYELLLQA